MRRRDFLALAGGSVGWPLAAQAQSPSLPVVGFLSSLSAASLAGVVVAFERGLESAGYEKGTNVAIEFRWAEGRYELLPALAADLVKHRSAVIVTIGGDPPAFAAKHASTTIPLVFIVGQDPVKLGLVTSLSHPGGNATGINLLVTETETKRLELLSKFVPADFAFAAIVNPNNADAEASINAVTSAAHAIGRRIEIANASNESDLENAFAGFARNRIGGFIVTADPFFVFRRGQIISAAAQRRLPGVYFLKEFAQSGGLASYGTNLVDAYRQAGVYAGKILAGTNPADLPVVQPTKFELIVNLKAAKELGLTVPADLLSIADEVIE